MLIVSISACSQPTPIPAPSPTPTFAGSRLPWDTVWKDDYCYSPADHSVKPGIYVITDPTESNQIQDKITERGFQKVDVVDFAKYFIVAVYQGYCGTTGYSTEVLNVSQEGQNIYVYARFKEPDENQPVGPITTDPCNIIEILKRPETKGALTFILIANDQEVARSTKELP